MLGVTFKDPLDQAVSLCSTAAEDHAPSHVITDPALQAAELTTCHGLLIDGSGSEFPDHGRYTVVLRAPEGLQLNLTGEMLNLPKDVTVHVTDTEDDTKLGVLRGTSLLDQKHEFVSTSSSLTVLLDSEDGGSGLPLLFGLRIGCVCSAEGPNLCGEHASCVDAQCQCDEPYYGARCELSHCVIGKDYSTGPAVAGHDTYEAIDTFSGPVYSPAECQQRCKDLDGCAFWDLAGPSNCRLRASPGTGLHEDAIGDTDTTDRTIYRGAGPRDCVSDDPCFDVNCGAHGSCIDGSCVCQSAAYSGNRCQNFDTCYGVQCGAHGSCIDGSCDCKDRYTGSTCGKAPLPCCSGAFCGDCPGVCSDCHNGAFDYLHPADYCGHYFSCRTCYTCDNKDDHCRGCSAGGDACDSGC
jgi:hypothetical protein